jgi:hypothetical protein
MFIYLRLKTASNIITKSQRWGLTLLGAIFMINVMIILLYLSVNETYNDFILRVIVDLQNFCSVLTIMFCMVFPRPVSDWMRMKKILLAVALTGGLFIGITIATGYASELVLSILHIIAWFLFPISWFWHSRTERSEPNRMILSILGWGFVFQPILDGVFVRAYQWTFTGPITLYDIMRAFYGGMEFLCGLVVIGIIILTLWERRGMWATADRLNLFFFFCLSLFLAGNYSLYPGTVPSESAYASLISFVSSSSWAFMRPILLAIGLLRYQLFGTEVRGDAVLRGIFWISGLGFVGAVLQGVLVGGDIIIRALWSGLAICLAAYPMYIGTKRLVSKLLPLSGGETKTSMAERRNSYLLGLQTAVADGRIGDEGDARALLDLRRKLGISDREHELLLTFFPKSDRGSDGGRVQELFLILQDGRLLAHAGKTGGDKELVAGMLSAIRGFVEEGLQGGSKELDAVKYGDYTLVMESERKVVLAALVLGPESPDVRVLLRDTLAEAMRLRGDVLEKWDGGSDKLKGLPELLGKALAPA